MNLAEKTQIITQAISQNYPQHESRISHRYRHCQLIFLRRSSEFVFVSLLQLMGLFFDFHATPPLVIKIGAALNLILVFWRGSQIWPGLLLASGLYWWYHGGSLAQSLLLSCLCTLQPIVIVRCCHRCKTPILPFAKLTEWFIYTLIILAGSVLFAELYSFIMGLDLYAAIKLSCTLVNGYLLLTPACLIWGSYPFIKELVSKQQWWIFAITLTLFFPILCWAFFIDTAQLLLGALVCCLIAGFLAYGHGRYLFALFLLCNVAGLLLINFSTTWIASSDVKTLWQLSVFALALTQIGFCSAHFGTTTKTPGLKS